MADEFIESRRASGLSAVYAKNREVHLQRFTARVKGNIAEVTVADINRFLTGLSTLAAISKNSVRRSIVTMLGFAKRQGYLHPDRRTAAERSESFQEPENRNRHLHSGRETPQSKPCPGIDPGRKRPDLEGNTH